MLAVCNTFQGFATVFAIGQIKYIVIDNLEKAMSY